MNSRILALGLLASIPLSGCGNSEQSSLTTEYRVVISGLRMEREEDRNDDRKSTTIAYNTKGSIEVTDNSGAKPSGFVFLKVADETGIAYGNTLANDEIVLIKSGTGLVAKEFSKTVPDGQSQPIPPKYTISAAGFIPFEFAEMVVGENAPTKGEKSATPRFQLLVEPIRVVKDDASFKGKGLLRIKALENVPNLPTFVFLNQKATKHPTAKLPAADQTVTLVVMNGEGSSAVSEYLGLTHKVDKDLNMVPVDEPQAPEYEYSIIGFYPMKPTKLTIK